MYLAGIYETTAVDVVESGPGSSATGAPTEGSVVCGEIFFLCLLR